MRTYFASLLFAFALAIALFSVVAAQQAIPQNVRPLGSHCIGVGPLPSSPPISLITPQDLADLTFCGCTWGEIYYRGQPVAGAQITMTFGSEMTNTITAKNDFTPIPIFVKPAKGLGAKRGDTLTVTATFAGQSVTRTFRAQPEADGEQHVPLVIPDAGLWQPLSNTAGYTRTLLATGNVLWAGGRDGLLQLDLTSGVSVTQSAPWPNLPVRALAMDGAGALWLAQSPGVAQLTGTSWQTYTLPFSDTVTALAVDPLNNVLWAGGGTANHGALARYENGSWQAVATDFSAQVIALAVDSTGNVWASLWGKGVVQQQGAQWITHRPTNAPIGSRIYAFYAETTAGAESMWLAQASYNASNGLRGGVARFDLSTSTWRVYTSTHGLPAKPTLPADHIYALAKDAGGLLWAGTEQGGYSLAAEQWQVKPPLTAPIYALAAAANGDLLAATQQGLWRLVTTALPGAPPSVTLSATKPPSFNLVKDVQLSASGADGDSDGAGIVNWTWTGAGGQPLCTTAASCIFPAAVLGTGSHPIALRVQDDEGAWSTPVTTTVTIFSALYLSAVSK